MFGCRREVWPEMASAEDVTVIGHAVEAASGVAEAGPGVVGVLLRATRACLVAHWPAGSAVSGVEGLAAIVGAEASVVVAVGRLRTAHPIIRAADAVSEAFQAAGLRVVAAVHVPELEVGALWTDLSAATARDGVVRRTVAAWRKAPAPRFIR